MKEQFMTVEHTALKSDYVRIEIVQKMYKYRRYLLEIRLC